MASDKKAKVFPTSLVASLPSTATTSIALMSHEVQATLTSISTEDEKKAVAMRSVNSVWDAATLKTLEADFKALFDISSFTGLAASDFEGFGLFNSHVYRKKFLRIAVSAGLSSADMTIVVLLFTAVKNKERVLNAMDRFSSKPWYIKVRSFIEKHLVQYSKEQSKDTFPVVNITSMAPSITAICWKFLNPSGNLIDFLGNTWASQMALPEDLKSVQKKQEIDFWTNIMITRNTMSTAEELGFHEKYWMTKARDAYPFIDSKGNIVSVKDEGTFKIWILT